MKKIVLSILCTAIVSAIVGVNSMLNTPTKEQPQEQLKPETKIEKVDEKIDTEDMAVIDEEIKEIKEEKPTETEKKETKSESTKKPSSSVSNVPKQETTKKQESRNENTSSTQPPTQQPQAKEQTDSNTKNDKSGQTNNVSTAFYDSITGGKKEFSSESACFARGTQIQNAELDYVLDYNEQHPEAPIQPEINYFRCYPVIDEQGEGWYLHFFCRSGEGLDSTLKSKY